MTKPWLFRGLMAVVFIGALALRLPRLDLRVMHGDEAVNTIKFRELYKSGTFKYDPVEYHGPSLYYLSLLRVWLSGADSFEQTSETTYRSLPAVFGALTVLLVVLLADGLGRTITVYVAVLTAVSPAMVFYSRYYIHETFLVFFSFVVIAAGWRYYRSRRPVWLMLAGAGVGLMHATKETCVVAMGAMALSLGATWLWQRRLEKPDERKPLRVKWLPLIASILVACAVSVLLFSAFFRHRRGPLDSLLTYVTYLNRAGEEGVHDHPWHYYFKTIAFTWYAHPPHVSEMLIVVLAAVGLAAAAAPNLLKGPVAVLARFLAVYALIMTAAYSAISYKTPWCFLGPLHAMILLAGIGAVTVYRNLPTVPVKDIACVLLALATTQLAAQSYLLNFKYPNDRHNPYIYGHPVPDVVRLAERVEEVSRTCPEGHDMLVKVISADYWPLPWYLRRFHKVGYWSEPPERPDAAVIISSTRLHPRVKERLEDKYHEEFFGLRPDVLLMVSVREDLWRELIRRRCAATASAGSAGHE